MEIRQPAVAGMFYPESPQDLGNTVKSLLAIDDPITMVPKVLIVPHAGYIYSGTVAAKAYHLLEPLKNTIQRVVMFGPSHRVPFTGLALPAAEAFNTPLGMINIDKIAIEQAAQLEDVQILDIAHTHEHCLEVQLPFLQTMLASFKLIPFVVGHASAESVANVIEQFWGGPETLIVISSDLSHYHPYQEAKTIDAATTEKIKLLDYHLHGEEACGCKPINGILLTAKRKGLEVTTLDTRNSGDTAGPKDTVVGYGAYALR
ncbi:AmmeMemoRadiSam system protein B [Endozoicomonas sp. SM1973]|uniref:MEMO1 family protein H0A36_19990 n=1 Tax=Spartinivicinus marinus TaxID=2994442 RepID=A0A853IEB5_9GAMM|nr:AmmeMemoRadiSam system protein B [Spartinivicinus marinus]MCX4025677.1 AmmeMemoRadiSam system protein B [Spartinivicinus marinus]NYZ68301.1 AmmeMemoRadiSam system protein B [Spartinivicinus marinus]